MASMPAIYTVIIIQLSDYVHIASRIAFVIASLFKYAP